MTKIEIITKAQLYLDDTSELSTSEFSDLFDKMYRKINRMKPWEGTKKEASGATSTSVAYISLPSDFLYLTLNGSYTGSSYEAGRPVIFRGVNNSKYSVVSWDDRRQYRDTNTAYLDMANSRLVFSTQPKVVESVDYDYHAQMPVLTDIDSPWFPDEYHDAIYHYMVSDDFIIQQSDKAKSYAKENWRDAEAIVADMAFYNSQLVQL